MAFFTFQLNALLGEAMFWPYLTYRNAPHPNLAYNSNPYQNPCRVTGNPTAESTK